MDNTQGKWDDMKKDVYGSKSYSVETYGEYIKGDSSISGKPTEDGWVDNKTIPANDGGCMVSLEGGTNGEDKNTSTLYVLFERAAGDPDDPENNPDEGSGDEDLTQSEIYDVTSVEGIVDEETFPGWPSTLLLGDTTFKTDDSTSKYMIARGEDKITPKRVYGKSISIK